MKASRTRPRDSRHNHRRCVADALAIAEQICTERSLRLTPLRRRVLELVWRQHDPVSAYELLAELARDGRGAAPPTVYRALEFLLDAGLVHRIDSLNAFIGCDRANLRHFAQFLVCRQCQNVTEIDDPEIAAALGRGVAHSQFQLDPVIEMKGLCQACRTSPD